MKYTKLGNSDLKVSRLCMGCMGFGDPNNGQHSWTLDEEHSREIIKRGLELGVNFFDTAVGYQSGTSEQYLGRAFLTRLWATRAVPASSTWDVLYVTLQRETRWRSLLNSCLARRKRSRLASAGSSTSKT